MRARLEPMAEAALVAWRADRAAGGAPLPDDGAGLEALSLVVDDVEVGGLVLTHSNGRCSLRVLHTTIPHEAADLWGAVLTALEEHARGRGARSLVTSVPPSLVRAFQAAGFQATMTGQYTRTEPGDPLHHQEDRRVALRPMDAAERAAFVTEAATTLRAGMERAGVLDGPGASMAEVDDRLRRLAAVEPPEDELLVTATVDDVPVGRAWATLVTDPDSGALDFLGNLLELDPDHRGRGLTKSFLGALARLVTEIGVRDYRLNTYGHDHAARKTFLGMGLGVTEVHLRKDLAGSTHQR